MKTLNIFFIKSSLLIIFLYSLIFNKKVNAQDHTWSLNLGSFSQERLLGVANDKSGQVYATGFFTGTVDFDPSANVANLVSNGGQDIFVAKYDANGNYDWAFNLGSNMADRGIDIVLDNFGNVIITGYFLDSMDFDPDPLIEVQLVGNPWPAKNAFIAKYTNTGLFIWANHLGTGTGNGVAVDDNNNIYGTGEIDSNHDFDPSANTATFPSNGSFDAYLVKYDFSGNYVFAQLMGSNLRDVGHSVLVDNNDNPVIAGYYSENANFGQTASGSLVTLAWSGDEDMFLAKYDPNGNNLFALSSTGMLAERAYDLGVDAADNIYVTGYFEDSANFDPNQSIPALQNAGARDIFLAKYDDSGNYIWANAMGGTFLDEANGISVDGAGNSILTGFFSFNADLDPSSNTASFTGIGSQDLFASCYSPNGDYAWGFNIGEGPPTVFGEIARGNAIVQHDGYFYIGGTFSGDMDFDPSSNVSQLNSDLGSLDGVIAKYSLPTKADEWCKVYGDTMANIPTRIKAFDNGVYVASQRENDVGLRTAIFTKFDITGGTVLWEVELDQPSRIFDFEYDPNRNELVLVGQTEPLAIGNNWQDNRSILIKVDASSGSVVCQKLYNQRGREHFSKILSLIHI